MTKWYLSKTLWANVISVAALIIQQYLGVTVTAEEAGALLVTVNLVARAITKESLEL